MIRPRLRHTPGRIRCWQCLLVLFCLLTLPKALALEIRPAFLSLSETQHGLFDVVWKRPTNGDTVVKLSPVFPDHCRMHWQLQVELTGDAKVERGQLTCGETDLSQGAIIIDGLETTLIDVLVRLQWLKGDTRQQLILPSAPSVQLDGDKTPVLSTYFTMGIKHILLSGTDHLMFVAALMMLIANTWVLLKTITAFTIAHSITLALASLGVVNMPAAPVEALISLSIAMMAAEAIRLRSGIRSLTVDKPWLVAFLFGLLHGLGFAGALAEVGLPEQDIPLALLLFNVGIEIGQILFVAVILTTLAIVKQLFSLHPSRGVYVSAYGIGTVGTWWGLEKVMAIVI